MARLLVVGASGRTGRLVVAEAQRRDHAVVAFARHDVPGVATVRGDLLDAGDVRRAVQGVDVVVDVAGSPFYRPTKVDSVGGAHLVAAMEEAGVRRLVATSVWGARESRVTMPAWRRWLFVPTLFRGMMREKEALEDAVRGSRLDWTLARPVDLSEAPGTGRVAALRTGAPAGSRLPRADLAAWLVEEATARRFVREAVVLAPAAGTQG